MADLIYKPDVHEYWDGNTQIPGITSVLSALGYNGKGSAFYTDDSRQKGTAVHKACAMADQEAPEEYSLEAVVEAAFGVLHPDIPPYLGGWLLFKQEKQYKPIAWETPMFSRKLRIACTPDNWGFLMKRGISDRHALVDMKSWKSKGAKPSRSSELQTAMQELVLRENSFIPAEAPVDRYVVKLSGNGKYRAYLCNNPLDAEHVIYAAKVWWDLRNHGLVSMSGDPDEEVAALE